MKGLTGSTGLSPSDNWENVLVLHDGRRKRGGSVGRGGRFGPNKMGFSVSPQLHLIRVDFSYQSYYPHLSLFIIMYQLAYVKCPAFNEMLLKFFGRITVKELS